MDQLTHQQRLDRTTFTVPEPLPSFGQYVPSVLNGAILTVGGHFGLSPDGSVYIGKVGADVSVETARLAARSAALNLVATVRDALGSLDRVSQVAHVFGVVNATPHFVEHTQVIDAASDVLVEIFGDAGRHARLAVGVNSLPGNLVLEITATIHIHP